MGTANFSVGDHVWVTDSELAWVDGIVQSVNGNEAEIETSNDNMVVAKLSNIHLKDTDCPDGGVDDMTKLLYLHEPGILHNLKTRYTIDEIYTYTGNILIALNPFKSISTLYEECVMERYKGTPTGEQTPHVYAIAEAAYRAMIDEAQSNSILVSGESGAGKTETTKMLMRYLAFMGGNTSTEGRTVEQKVLESNPVLEAFGNAKTVRNNNSSRFGKFVEIQFDKHGRISGAAIRTYLLERSRVCQISDAERNYHCFYLLCAAPPEDIEKYKLGHPQSFHYLNQSSCYELAGVNDGKDYIATRRAMDIVGIREQDQEAVFRIIAAILHLGNVDFVNEEEEVPSSVIKDDKSRFHLQMTAELLMCDPQEIEDALCKRLMVTGRDKIKKSLDDVGAAVSRDGLAKTIYSRLFNWLVDKINESIGQDSKSSGLIGVLDIYGFESFDSNSFEQFCINFTNEKLQQHFNQHVLKSDQEEYTKEDISWSYIEFVDNTDVLDLIEKKPGGIIALLDEACILPKSTHETFSEKLYQTFQGHKRFIKPKLARSEFTVVHYAGEVQYQSDQFLEKNKDYVVPEHQDLLSASKCSFVAGLFPPVSEEARKSSKFSSIGSRFKIQLQQLMDTLNSTKPHYIRCVKPNNALKPALYDNICVLRQLRSGGVLEAIKIKCGGFPAQIPFEEFLTRFLILAPEVLNGSYEQNVACKWILEKMEIEGYQIGKTKVFLRSGHMHDLDAHKARLLKNSAQTIQRKMKTRFTRKHFLSMRRASVRVQTYWRGKMARNFYKELKIEKRERAAIHIQKDLRRLTARRTFKSSRSSAVVLQAGVRADCARRELKFRRRSRAATMIQASWRGHVVFSNYKNIRRAGQKGLPVSKMNSLLRTNGQRIHILENAVIESDPLPAKEQEVAEKKTDKTPVEEKKQKKMKVQESKVDKVNVSREGKKVQVARSTTVKEHEIPLQDDDDKVKGLSEEVQNLKALLHELERKYAVAQEASDERQKRAKEMEEKVNNLQVFLKRMIYSMSDQFTEMKSILHTFSNSSSNSDAAAVNMSNLSPHALNAMVHDISGVDISGSARSGSKKEGAFDVF